MVECPSNLIAQSPHPQWWYQSSSWPSSWCPTMLIVVHRLTSRKHTDLVVDRVRVGIIAMLQWTIYHSLDSDLCQSSISLQAIYCSDEKHPNGTTMIPWRNGKLLVWDTTSPDTFAPLICLKSYQWSRSSGCSGRGQEYSCLELTYTFTPIAIETSGVFGPWTLYSF